MHIKTVDGIQCVVLKENEKVCLMSSAGEDDGRSIEVTSDGDTLDITGDSSAIGKIKGKGMLEKVYIPPVLNKEEILAKCDEWFGMFTEVLDIFSTLVENEKYREQNIVMSLHSGSVLGVDGDGKTIGLDLTNICGVVKKGVSIYIDDANEDIFKYLIVRVIDYFLSRCCEYKKVDAGVNFNGIISVSSSKIKYMDEKNKIAYLGSLMDCGYRGLIESILVEHNLGNTSDQLIDTLKSNIVPQQLASDSIDRHIKLTSIQHQHIKNMGN